MKHPITFQAQIEAVEISGLFDIFESFLLQIEKYGVIRSQLCIGLSVITPNAPAQEQSFRPESSRES